MESQGECNNIQVTTTSNAKVLKKEDLEGKLHNVQSSKINPFLSTKANGGKVTKIK